MANETKSAIPENVIQALYDARNIGRYNMYDMHAVIRMILNEIDGAAALWLDDNPDRYMEALRVMGERVRKEKEGGA